MRHVPQLAAVLLLAATAAHAQSASCSVRPAPTPASPIAQVHALLEADDFRAALTAAQSALAALPTSATPATSSDLNALLGETLLRAGRVTEAAAPISKALSADQCSPRARYSLALYNQLISKRATAAAQLASAHKLSPDDAQITSAWALTLPLAEQAAALKPLLASNTLSPAEAARLSISLAIATAGAACTATWPDKPFKADLRGLMVTGTHARSYAIPMHIGNANIATVDFDSAVAGIVLSQRDAKSANIHVLEGLTPSANGTYYATVDSVRVGPAEFHNCPVRVATNETLGNANSLVGTDFFRDRLIHIDYIDRSVTFSPPATPSTALLADRAAPPTEKDWSPAYIAGSNILIPTTINAKGPFLMLLATGAEEDVFAPLIGEGKPITYKDTQIGLRGSSSDIIKFIPQVNGGDADHALIYGPARNLLAVSIPIRNPIIIFYNNSQLDLESFSLDITPKSHEAGVEISGLLGFTTLKDYTLDIDYRNGLVHFVYDQLHRYAERELIRKQ